MESDAIIIRGLELRVHIGVPDEERAAVQVITADLQITLRRGFDAMQDDIGRTVDYAAVADRVRTIAAERPRRLLEQLAAEIVAALLRVELVDGVEVELRKRILPGTDHVAVRMSRRRS
jgi:dihydroneopterin aldolase